MVDLSCYSDVLGGKNHARYKIKSYIVAHFFAHSLSHYVSYIEVNGKYYCCDEINQEITQENFLNKKNPYIVVLERVSESKED